MFWIRSVGSDHLWWMLNDGSVLWQRLPCRRHCRSRPTPPLAVGEDETWIPLKRIERWPRRGDRATLWFDDPKEPFAAEQWRYVSLIASITREG